MAPANLECLGCGARRPVIQLATTTVGSGECPRCGYVGWADSSELTELTRRALRDRPLERRRLRRAS
jgi:Zn-finger nucleic acid-binding protein